MKIYHVALLFVIILLATVVVTDIQTNNMKAVIENKKQIDRYVDTAIDDGVTRLAEVDASNHIAVNKEAAVNSFFMSLCSAFGVLSDKEGREKLSVYVPVITITMEDGYYIFYSDEFTGADGFTYVSKRWSEKFPYYYEDADFIYGFTLGDVVTIYDKNDLFGGGTARTVYRMDYHDIQTKDTFVTFRSVRPNCILIDNENFELVRKGAIITSIENSMAYYTSQHNLIAAQYGITYNFSLPVISEEQWAPYLKDVGMFVLFQGYPFGEQIGETYNRVATAGAKVSKSKIYYIEQKGWYLVYHKSTCPELLLGGIMFKDEPQYDAMSCVKQGAYNCPRCFENGVFAPEYTP